MYKNIITYRYQLEVWDDCHTTIETDGRRYRVRYNYTDWHNHSSARCAEAKVYYDLAAGAKIVHAALCAKSVFDHDDDPRGYLPTEIIERGLTSNYSNAPASSPHPLDDLPLVYGNPYPNSY